MDSGHTDKPLQSILAAKRFSFSGLL